MPFLAAKTFWGIYLALEEREEDIRNFTATVSIWLRQNGEDGEIVVAHEPVGVYDPTGQDVKIKDLANSFRTGRTGLAETKQLRFRNNKMRVAS